MRTIDWRDGYVIAIDQTRLPHELVHLRLRTVDELVDAIRRLAIRGAPALGAAGALGVVLAASQGRRVRWAEIEALRSARPTAVNLAWGVDQVVGEIGRGPDAVLAAAIDVVERDVSRNHAMGRRGADWLAERVSGTAGMIGTAETAGKVEKIAVHTHCNAGALACVEWGTALGVVRTLHERGLLGHVYVDETRPLLQGSRLTVWELARLGAEHTLVADAAGPTVLARGLADAVVVGADRIAANGDVVNKVGTYPLALAASRAGVPFLVAAPESTIDLATSAGDQVEIEVRAAEELVRFADVAVAPDGTAALNYAFDVTPADLVTAIVTEDRVLHPSAGDLP